MASKIVRYVVKRPKGEDLISENTSSGFFEIPQPDATRVLLKITRVGNASGNLVDVNRRRRGQRRMHAESSTSTKVESTD